MARRLPGGRRRSDRLPRRRPGELVERTRRRPPASSRPRVFAAPGGIGQHPGRRWVSSRSRIPSSPTPRSPPSQQNVTAEAATPGCATADPHVHVHQVLTPSTTMPSRCRTAPGSSRPRRLAGPSRRRSSTNITVAGRRRRLDSCRRPADRPGSRRGDRQARPHSRPEGSAVMRRAAARGCARDDSGLGHDRAARDLSMLTVIVLSMVGACCSCRPRRSRQRRRRHSNSNDDRVECRQRGHRRAARRRRTWQRPDGSPTPPIVAGTRSTLTDLLAVEHQPDEPARRRRVDDHPRLAEGRRRGPLHGERRPAASGPSAPCAARHHQARDLGTGVLAPTRYDRRPALHLPRRATTSPIVIGTGKPHRHAAPGRADQGRASWPVAEHSTNDPPSIVNTVVLRNLGLEPRAT